MFRGQKDPRHFIRLRLRRAGYSAVEWIELDRCSLRTFSRIVNGLFPGLCREIEASQPRTQASENLSRGVRGDAEEPALLSAAPRAPRANLAQGRRQTCWSLRPNSQTDGRKESTRGAKQMLLCSARSCAWFILSRRSKNKAHFRDPRGAAARSKS